MCICGKGCGWNQGWCCRSTSTLPMAGAEGRPGRWRGVLEGGLAARPPGGCSPQIVMLCIGGTPDASRCAPGCRMTSCSGSALDRDGPTRAPKLGGERGRSAVSSHERGPLWSMITTTTMTRWFRARSSTSSTSSQVKPCKVFASSLKTVLLPIVVVDGDEIFISISGRSRATLRARKEGLLRAPVDEKQDHEHQSRLINRAQIMGGR